MTFLNRPNKVGLNVRSFVRPSTKFFFDFNEIWHVLNPERKSAKKPKTKHGRLVSLASNPLVTVPILELWAKVG